MTQTIIIGLIISVIAIALEEWNEWRNKKKCQQQKREEDISNK